MDQSRECKLLLAAHGHHSPLRCRWHVRHYDKGPGHGAALSLAIGPGSPDAAGPAVTLPAESSGAEDGPGRFLADAVAEAAAAGAPRPVALSFILPAVSGYAMRSDLVGRRLESSALVDSVAGFLRPLQPVSNALPKSDEDLPPLPTLLSAAVAGIRVKLAPGQDVDGALASLSRELENRLSLAWLSPAPIARKRLVFVEARRDIDSSLRIYEAADALGIDLVVMDNPGHWFQDDKGPYAYLREAFLPVDISVDDGFVDRIVDAVRAYDKPVDGIMTISDGRLPGVARACEMLGLSTAPSAAQRLAGDKGKTRLMEPDTGGAFAVANAAELREKLAREGLPHGLSYPLVVKPCMGWGSEGVSKVSNEKELVEAAERASKHYANSAQKRTELIIERYVDGPEVDANCVLLHGKIVFFEFTDDFPSRGDHPGATSHDNFLETMMVLPSGLTQRDRHVARDSIEKSLVRMGFSSGVFHCEGRIENSSMHYVVDEDGLEDLEQGRDTKGEAPSFYLHEINARPPGYLLSVPVFMTFGVDYYAQQQLFAVGDMDRFASLAHEFYGSPPWHVGLMLVPQEGSGIMKTPDAVLDLMERHEDLKQAIAHHHTVIKGGDRLAGHATGDMTWVANLSVVSRKSRKDCLRLVRRVRQEFKYELE